MSDHDEHPVATADFTITGKNSTDLDQRARKIAAEFADGRPHSVEINADAVMTWGGNEPVAWQARCTVTVWYELHGVTHRSDNPRS